MTSIFLSVAARISRPSLCDLTAFLTETNDLCYHAPPDSTMASLIYHAGALGDFITTLPAMSRWRELRQGERFIVLGKPAHAALARPPFDEAWDAEAAAFSPLFSESGVPGPGLARVLAGVTSALLFAAGSSHMPGCIARMGVKEVVRQDPFPPPGVHVVDYHLSLFPGRISAADSIPRILVTAQARRDVVAIHVGSGNPGKNWPLQRFEELAARLAEQGLRIAWIVGPAEKNIVPPRDAEAWRFLPLRELAGRLAGCRLYVGNDSGVTHLAAASGAPTVALFGGSDPLTWAPRGARVAVLATDSRNMSAIGLGDVLPVCEDFLKEK
jgi:heptosyltransferase-3